MAGRPRTHPEGVEIREIGIGLPINLFDWLSKLVHAKGTSRAAYVRGLIEQARADGEKAGI